MYIMIVMYKTNSFFVGLLLGLGLSLAPPRLGLLPGLAPPRLGLVLLGLLLLAALVPLLVIITLFLFIL